MLSTTGLTFSYPGGQLLTFPDVKLGSAQNLVVLGPSGSGKSTLIGLWSGLLSPKQGTVTVDGVLVNSLSGSKRDRWRGANVGLVFQTARLIASQTIRANVSLQALLSAKPVSEQTILEGLQSLDIAHLSDRFPRHCSVGERQRAGILRALIHEPKLLLADEPTSALDKENALAVAQLLLKESKRRNATLVVVTHDDRIIKLFDRVLILDKLDHNSL